MSSYSADDENRWRRCPACASAAGAGRGEKNGFRLLTCCGCGTIYTSRLPDGSDAQDYDAYYSAANTSVPVFVHARLDEIVGGFAAYRQQNRLLDVGCGAGSLLQAAARAQWNAEGLEVSKPVACYVASLGFKVFSGELSDARYPDDYFDVVTASEVVEHVPDPEAVVKEVARILRPGGLFWATTPHGRGVSARLLKRDWSAVAPPEHLQLFSVKGMKTMLKSVGFRKVEVAAQSVNPYELIHVLRERRHGGTGDKRNGEASFDRGETSYALNEALMRSGSRRALKQTINALLTVGRLGDSLKVYAVK